MPLSEAQKEEIATLLRDKLRDKMRRHNPEPAHMPFHIRLLGGDRMAMFSFIHSLNTSFGTTIFESVAEVMAKEKFASVERQAEVGTCITSHAQNAIQEKMNHLGTCAQQPNQEEEIAAIREVCQSGEPRHVNLRKADLKLVDENGAIYLIDIKTAKPNVSGFEGHKKMLMEWAAAVLYENPEAEVSALVAIPYNPYAPNPYRRWTLRGMMDLERELKVAEDFWDFLVGDESYDELLDIFQQIGTELRPEIDAYFNRHL